MNRIEKIRNYFENHNGQREAVMFAFFSLLAGIAQLIVRWVLDLVLRNLTTTVEIWPFPEQALGSLLAFLISNVVAKAMSYAINRTQTFQADNDLRVSVVLYTILTIIVIALETIVGVPLQNWCYEIMGGTFTSAHHMTTTAAQLGLYQVAGTISVCIYNFFGGIVVFVMDKFLIMRKK
ncbi:MAG: hypothetical protein LUC17_00985 [Oscillospiraceae bacterium]|nr:hypothetical protein [Oscillospiraceae bacterium]